MAQRAYGKKAGTPEGAVMTDISYPVFIEKNMEPVISNVTYTTAEWMQLVSDIHQAQSTAMTVGLIIGFIVGIVALSFGLWWKNTGSTWWRNRGN